ncbi:hypothetical protein GDO78_009622 [Eleutherodactylus coqui]|uniref:Uncharacterized protein n=1 Tax=Eleutherodactylus coqui TaxID=57060 RepID=A0A8J6FAK7_ELECQ|nr:hypothetical protein GDO78_009622 [Eleutherodactylus coqui]
MDQSLSWSLAFIWGIMCILPPPDWLRERKVDIRHPCISSLPKITKPEAFTWCRHVALPYFYWLKEQEVHSNWSGEGAAYR